MQHPEDVVAEHAGAIARVVALFARTRSEQEDLLQDTLLAVVRALPRFRGESAMRTYVLRIAHRCGLRHALRHRRLRAVEGELIDVAAPTPSPEAMLLRSERLERLDQLLSELPLASRQVLALTLEGCSQSEIGEVLGMRSGAVAARLHRVRKALRFVDPEDGG